MKTDFSACILTGEAALRERLENIAGSYSPESGCFAALAQKAGREFEVTACGFLLLDNLLLKNRINRADLIIADGGNPRIINRSDIAFGIAAAESCVMCCLAVGEGAEIDCRISRGSVTPPENCFETGVITSCGIKYHYSIGGRSAD